MKSFKKKKGYTLIEAVMDAFIGVMFLGTGIVVAAPDEIVATKEPSIVASQNALSDVCKEAHLTTCY